MTPMNGSNHEGKLPGSSVALHLLRADHQDWVIELEDPDAWVHPWRATRSLANQGAGATELRGDSADNLRQLLSTVTALDQPQDPRSAR